MYHKRQKANTNLKPHIFSDSFYSDRIIWIEIFSCINIKKLANYRLTCKMWNQLILQYFEFTSKLFDISSQQMQERLNRLSTEQQAQFNSVLQLEQNFNNFHTQIQNKFIHYSFFSIRTYEVPPKILGDIMLPMLEILSSPTQVINWRAVRIALSDPYYFIERMSALRLDELQAEKLSKIRKFLPSDDDDMTKKKLKLEIHIQLVEQFYDWLVLILTYSDEMETFTKEMKDLKKIVLNEKQKEPDGLYIKKFLSAAKQIDTS